MKLNKGFLQVGLVIGIASALAAFLIIDKLGGVASVSDLLAKKDPPGVVALKKRIEKCSQTTPTWICKGITNNPKKQDPDGKCHPAGTEGCLTDYRDDAGKFCYAIKDPKCGNKNIDEPNPTPVPTPTPTPSHTPNPTLTPTPVVTPSPTPVSTPESTPTPTSTPIPQGTPNYCGGTCGSNYNCQGGLFCYQGYCRNPDCPGESTCGCRTATPTPPPVLGASTPPHLPKTGSDDLGVLAGLIGIGASGLFIFKKFQLI